MYTVDTHQDRNSLSSKEGDRTVKETEMAARAAVGVVGFRG